MRPQHMTAPSFVVCEALGGRSSSDVGGKDTLATTPFFVVHLDIPWFAARICAGGTFPNGVANPYALRMQVHPLPVANSGQVLRSVLGHSYLQEAVRAFARETLDRYDDSPPEVLWHDGAVPPEWLVGFTDTDACIVHTSPPVFASWHQAGLVSHPGLAVDESFLAEAADRLATWLEQRGD